MNFRKFGVEIEINAFNDRIGDKDILPDGIHYVGNLIVKTLGKYVEIRKWGFTTWHDECGYWVVKPDASCGIEICSPVMKGWLGLKEICQLVDILAQDDKISADERCSLHIHVDVTDLLYNQIGQIIYYWIKCEPVFIDSIPAGRKRNKYCQFIGLWDWFKTDSKYEPRELVKLLGKNKYTSLNTYHLHQGERQTIEFRLGDSGYCKNSYNFKNWVKLILQFVEITKDRPVKCPYTWLDPIEVLQLLDLDPQLKNWFIGRLFSHVSFSRERSIARNEIMELKRNSNLPEVLLR